MRKILLVIPFLFLMAGCQCGQGTTEQVAPLVGEVVDPVFVPVFEATRSHLESRRGCAVYPIRKALKLKWMTFVT